MRTQDVLPAGTPEIKLIADPETRRRVAMAAESDLEAFRYAHWRGTVTFHDVASSWFHMSDPNLPDELRAEFKALFPGLLDAFAEPRKGIITAYFCRHIRVAAALTDIGHAADAPEGVPEATLKGPPPAGIRAMLEQQTVEPDTNGHADPRARAHLWRARATATTASRSGAASSPAARASSSRRRPPARRSTSNPRSATPRTGRPRRSSSSACTCTTRRSSSSHRSRARSACG
jgi:hypothetical protein